VGLEKDPKAPAGEALPGRTERCSHLGGVVRVVIKHDYTTALPFLFKSSGGSGRFSQNFKVFVTLSENVTGFGGRGQGRQRVEDVVLAGQGQRRPAQEIIAPPEIEVDSAPGGIAQVFGPPRMARAPAP